VATSHFPQSGVATKKGIPLDYIKSTFSLLVITLYFMFNMQWNMNFCSFKGFNKEKTYQCNFFLVGHSNKENYVAVHPVQKHYPPCDWEIHLHLHLVNFQ
jgi:hypothetical protein